MKDKRFSVNHVEIQKVFAEEKSTLKTANKLNIKQSQVQYSLKRYNKQLTAREAQLKHTCDWSYFKNIDSQEKAYWLGFIYADGCISDTSKKGNKRFQLTLSIKDLAHLEDFKKAINASHLIHQYVVKKGKMIGHKYATIKITSDDFCNDLILHGCTPRKSNALFFPSLEKSFINHFIRGYFDGDGSVFISKEKHWRTKKISDVIHYRFGGTESFLSSVAKEINLGKSLKKAKRSVMYELSYKRNKKVIPFKDYLYHNATTFMSRKKIIFDNHINKIKVQRLQ